MKHYIITRFASWDYLGDKKIFTEECLKSSFKKLKIALLNTLENQTNKNFTLLITIHNNIEKEKIQFLYELKGSFDIKVLRNKEVNEFIKQDAKDEKLVIFSRIDIDDFLLNTVVDNVQKEVSKQTTDYIFLGLYNGATFTYNDKQVYFFPTKPYIKNQTGSFSALMTIACNNNKCNEYIDKMEELSLQTPLAYNHTKVFLCAKNVLDKNDSVTTLFLKSKNENPLYLWTGYGDNGTTMKRQQNNENTNWHKSSMKIELDFSKYMKTL